MKVEKQMQLAPLQAGRNGATPTLADWELAAQLEELGEDEALELTHRELEKVRWR